MRIDQAIPHVKSQLTKKRFDHTIRVVEQAIELAELYDVDTEKASLAAVFHDYAKNRPLEEMRRLIIESTLPKDLLNHHHELWHGPVGSILVKREHGVIDMDIHSAIQYHTTGKAHMSKLELVIYVADYIEPGRDFPGVEEVRMIAQKDLIQAAWLVSRNTIQFLLEKRAQVYPDTYHAYNDLTRRLFERQEN